MPALVIFNELAAVRRRVSPTKYRGRFAEAVAFFLQLADPAPGCGQLRLDVITAGLRGGRRRGITTARGRRKIAES
ncbi:hypothetical protein ACWGE1_02610 [Streptomyces sp. NPDC054932]